MVGKGATNTDKGPAAQLELPGQKGEKACAFQAEPSLPRFTCLPFSASPSPPPAILLALGVATHAQYSR
jgi:hypothetical protein